MPTLAVASRMETFDRLRANLPERGIEVVPITPQRRTFDLGDPDWPDADVGFVYPPRIMEGGVVDAGLDVPWVNDREAVLRSRNKGGALARLAAAGVPTPETRMVSNPLDDHAALVETFEAVDGPVVVKPNSTTQGVGVARAADLDSFLGLVDYLDLVHDYRATADRSFLVQEFVADARDVRAMVVDGEVVGAVERRLPADVPDGQWKHNVHRGADAEGIDLDPGLRRMAERTASVLDVPYLGVDLLVTEERAVVSETNARPTIDDGKYAEGFWDDLAALVDGHAETESDHS